MYDAKTAATISALPSHAPPTPRAKALVAAAASGGSWLHAKASVDVILREGAIRNRK